MEIVLLLARLILAVVFGVAGVAKLTDPEGARQALIGFGVSEELAKGLGWILPIAEILVALLLLPLQTAWLGGIGALTLLLVFSVGIGVNLVRGHTPDCHCFGQLHSEPVSWQMFARNLALAAVASTIVVAGPTHPGLSAFAWMADLKAVELITLIASVVAMGIAVTALMYLRRILTHQETVLEHLDAMKKVIDEDYAESAPIERDGALPPSEGLPVGAVAPAFALPTLEGNRVSLTNLLAHGKSVLLLFASPSCAPCKSLLPLVRVWEREYHDYLTIAILSEGTLKANQNKMSKYEARYLLLQEEALVSNQYQSRWTPAAVLINSNGKIASPVTPGEDAIKMLVHHTVTTSAGQSANINGDIPQIGVGTSLFKLGDPSPRFSLPDLTGRIVQIEDFWGQETMLLFWSPHCSYCQAMSEDLKAWEENPPQGAPQLVYVSSHHGDKTETKDNTLPSNMLLDTEFDIGPLFGIKGTPSAILIDRQGRIASSLATGAHNILALAGIYKVELPILNG